MFDQMQMSPELIEEALRQLRAKEQGDLDEHVGMPDAPDDATARLAAVLGALRR
jgi:hypothetical protein